MNSRTLVAGQPVTRCTPSARHAVVPTGPTKAWLTECLLLSTVGPPTSHGQYDTELSLAAHHPRIGLVRFFERIGLDHGAHVGQLGKAQRVLGIGRRSRGPALDRPASTDELDRGDLDGIEGRADHQELPVRGQAVDQRGHRLRVWGRRQDDLGPAELLQFLSRVRRLAVDVGARSELLCQRGVRGTAADGRDPVAELVRELNSYAPERADT